MSIEYLSDILPLEQAGRTDEQIAKYYADKTATSIQCSDVKILLEESGLIIEDPITNVRGGILADYYSGLPDGNAKILLGWFISHVFGRGEVIASDTQPRASQIVSAIADLPDPIKAIGEKIIELGGGKPYGNLTAQDISDIRNAYLTLMAEPLRKDSILALKSEIENTWLNPAYSDGVSTAEQVRAAIKAGL